MPETGTYIAIIIAICIAWPIWVMVLCKVFEQPRPVDTICSLIGLVVMITAELSK